MPTQQSNGLLVLIAAAGTFMLLGILPFGGLILWPFNLITTFVHEMGHGITAILSGGSIAKIEVFVNGSGLATTRHSGGFSNSNIGNALRAAGGLIAPSVIGSLFIIAGKSRKASSRTLLVFSLFILICCLLWVRTTTGFLILVPAGALFLFISLKASAIIQHFLIQFMGVFMLVDTFTDNIRYLFIKNAIIDGQDRHSDSAVIAQNLIGGHFMWACIIAAITFALFFLSLKHSYLKK